MFYYQAPTTYDSAEWTSGVVTNYDVSAQTLFVNCKNPQRVVVRVDADVTIRFNSASNPAITVKANSTFDIDFQFSALFLTTTGSTGVKIMLMQRDIA